MRGRLGTPPACERERIAGEVAGLGQPGEQRVKDRQRLAHAGGGRELALARCGTGKLFRLDVGCLRHLRPRSSVLFDPPHKF